jgi:hypothetical protein
LFQLQGSFFRAFGASSFTEAGFAWCARWSLSWVWPPYSVTTIFSRIGVGENKLFTAHFFPSWPALVQSRVSGSYPTAFMET